MILLSVLALAATVCTHSIVGTWTKDISASTKVEGEPMPLRVTFIVTTDTATRIAFQSEVVDDKGESITTTYEGRYDGGPYKLSGDVSGSRIAFKRIDRLRFQEIIYSPRGDKVGLVCALQPGEKTLICDGKDAHGNPIKELYHREPYRPAR